MIKIQGSRFASRQAKLKLQSFIKHPLFAGSAVMIVGSNLSNAFAYLYHLVVGRLLGPAAYGELAAVLSLYGIIATSFGFLGLVIVKFVSASDEEEIPKIFSWFTKKSFIFGLILALGVVLATPAISKFLFIKPETIFLLAPIFIFAVLGFVYRSFLQGLLRFKEVVIASNLDIIGRLVLGVLFIHLGFSVFGAVLGLVLSAFVSFSLLRYYLREYRLTKENGNFNRTKEMFIYSIPIFVASAAGFSMLSTDLLLVKHFLPAFDAGIYAALSTLGKIIFYGAAPVSSVMFPMISKRHARGHGFRKIFLLSLFLTTVISVGVLFIYWLLPEFSINFLYGKRFLSAAPYLVWFGGFMAIYSLSSLILNFYLSKKQTRVVIFVVIAAIGQALGIWFFHETILTVIKVSIASASFLLVSLLIYFGYEAYKSRS